jgi:ATP/maltotriose-dependent transcriptional regulator MalT
VTTHVVDRPRLRALLTDGIEAPVTVVAATAGWGKTLLAGPGWPPMLLTG